MILSLNNDLPFLESQLYRLARERTGLYDLGTSELPRSLIRSQLRQLKLQSYTLQPKYIQFVLENLVNQLENRLHFVAAPKAEVKLPPIIFIVSEFRSGSTRLQKLLSLDPQFQYVDLKSALSPLADKDPSWFFSWYSDELQSFHKLVGSEPCELQMHTSALGATSALFTPPCLTHGMCAPVATEYRELLSLQIKDKTKPLVLKFASGTASSRFVSALIDVLDPKLLFTVRDPSTRTQSSSNFNKALANSMQIKPSSLHRDLLRSSGFTTSTTEYDALKDRDNCVVYSDMVKDPKSEITRIYEYLGFSCPDVVFDNLNTRM